MVLRKKLYFMARMLTTSKSTSLALEGEEIQALVGVVRESLVPGIRCRQLPRLHQPTKKHSLTWQLPFNSSKEVLAARYVSYCV